jgi:hypothetical protein
VPLRPAGAGPLRATLARESFCALAHAGKFVAEPAAQMSGGSGLQAPIEFDVTAFEGVAGLIAEACP